MGLVVTHTHPGPHGSGSDSHAPWSDHMGLVVTHTHPGPHGSGDGDSNLGSHRDRQVDEERVARDALGVGPQIAVVLHHLCVDGLRHSLTAHLLLHNTTTLPLTHTHTHTHARTHTSVCVCQLLCEKVFICCTDKKKTRLAEQMSIARNIQSTRQRGHTQ